MNKTKTVLLLALLLLNVLLAAGYVPYKKSHLKMQKLCSKSLSDALYVVCRESGYNEPFSYSGEDEPRADTGPGLVEECCYHSCSYDQLTQYCKPLPEEKRADSRDVIGESNVANLPYSTSTRDLSSEQNPPLEMDHVGGAIKRKVDDLKRGRHRGKGGRNDDECRGKADAKKRHRGRHCRCRHRRLQCRRASKVLP
ncbi:Insulin-like growth factor I [Ooceraea biroi]|uniref:Insulin-like growth factor I n=1 Tax=Ooceraea biroi TaxID=2015173 RepID=A0A026W3R0_OOCBI|nr:Insulin-like growth factor I [Ooceraea biroi]